MKSRKQLLYKNTNAIEVIENIGQAVSGQRILVSTGMGSESAYVTEVGTTSGQVVMNKNGDIAGGNFGAISGNYGDRLYGTSRYDLEANAVVTMNFIPDNSTAAAKYPHGTLFTLEKSSATIGFFILLTSFSTNPRLIGFCDTSVKAGVGIGLSALKPRLE